MGPSDQELAALAQAFCTNNAASATEARLLQSRKELLDLQREVEKRAEELADLAREARAWVEKREKYLASAREGLVETYSKMKPEAAAQQIGAMSDDAAISILVSLAPRASSAILNEMAPDKAARFADAAIRRATPRVKEKNG